MSRKARMGRRPPDHDQDLPTLLYSFDGIPVQRIEETEYEKALRELNAEFPGVRDIFA